MQEKKPLSAVSVILKENTISLLMKTSRLKMV